MSNRTRKKNKTGEKPLSAAQADKHTLYERAVQCVESEIDFIEGTYRKLRKYPARSLREDFCGTTNTSCEWVRRHRDNRAFCVDIDKRVLEWGMGQRIATLKEHQAARLEVLNEDVLKVKCEPVDVVLAMNFSYWIFKTRKSLGNYFRRVKNGLKPDGVFFLDAYGGYEAFQEMEEQTEFRDFTYIWDQYHYNPISGDTTCYIHFSFPDGSRLDRAFQYDWRLWTLPELTEILEESGFSATVYWEGEDAKGEGNGIFAPATEGAADAGWVAYIVAERLK